MISPLEEVQQLFGVETTHEAAVQLRGIISGMNVDKPFSREIADFLAAQNSAHFAPFTAVFAEIYIEDPAGWWQLVLETHYFRGLYYFLSGIGAVPRMFVIPTNLLPLFARKLYMLETRTNNYGYAPYY